MEEQHLKYTTERAESYLEYISDIFYAVLEKQGPLDRQIKGYFRKHKECGSRDRLLITESLFSLFRWYGWVQPKLPSHPPEDPCLSQDFCTALAAALWLDNQPFSQFMEMLYSLGDVNVVGLGSSPEAVEDKIKGLSYFFKIRKSQVLSLVPAWFKEKVLEENLPSMIESFQKRPPIWIRIQKSAEESVLAEMAEKGVAVASHKVVSHAFKILADKLNVKGMSTFQKGCFEIQDLASQCLGRVCDASADEVWWDVCAGAGGKSLLLADQMKGKGKVVATDTRSSAIKELDKRVVRSNFQNIEVADLDEVMVSSKEFDGVLIDAPCSCTGVWRRSPDLRWIASSDTCEKSISLQKEILEFSSQKVKTGGVLVYATCSVLAEENEDVVEAFLKSHPEFLLEGFLHPLTGEMTGGMMRVHFTSDDCDATFAARFRRA